MPTRTGTAIQVNGSGGNGSTSVTIPADCDLIVAFWCHWDSNGGTTLSGLTLGGTSLLPALAELAEGAAADENGIGVAVLESPATGSQTLAWTWSAGGARSEGGEIVLVPYKDANTGDAVRDAGVNATTAGTDLSVTIDSATDDVILAFAQSFTGLDPALTATLFIDDAAVNSHQYDVGEVTPSAGTTTVTMTGENYSAMAAISLKAAVAGDATAPTYSVAPAESSNTSTSTTCVATASDETDSTVNHYAVAVANAASAPSTTQIKAGQDSTGSAAIASGSDLAVANGVAGSITLTGLTASTAYDIYWTCEDQSSNLAAAQKIDVTTDAAAGLSILLAMSHYQRLH